jgi:hypothetical protein
MDSMLKAKLPDDPRDIPVVAPDAIRVAPADEAPSDPIRDLIPGASLEPQIHAESDFSASAAVPPLDATFRPAAVNTGRGRSAARRALRAVAAFVLTACIGGAALAWNSHGDSVQHLIAEWAPLFAKPSPASEKAARPVQPTLAAAQVDATNAPGPQAAPQAAPTAVAVAPGAATPPGQPSIETMARNLASAGQEIEALKASIEQLKASQQQLVAMVSEKASVQAAHPRKPASPPRPVAALAPARKPPPLSPAPLPPRQAIAAPPLTQAPAPYAPRQIEPVPPTTAETLDDAELRSVPRPPMPLR